VETISQPVVQAVETISQPVVQAVETISQPVVQAVETISEPVVQAVETIDEAANAVGDVASNVGELASSVVDEAANTVDEAVNTIGEGVGETINTIGSGIGEAINTIGDIVYTAEQLAEIVEDISSGDYDSAFQTAGDMIGGPTGAIVSSVGELLEGDIGEALIEAGAGVGEIYEYELAGSALVIAGHLYNEDSTGVINELDSLTGGNFQQFSSDIQNVENDVINELDSLTGGNFQLFSSVVQNVEDGNYVEAFMDMAPILVQLGDETSGYVGEGLATFGEILQYDIGGAVERASRTVGSIYGGPIGEELAGAVGSVLGDALSDSLSNFLA
jgi:hypothetical protein